MSEANLPPHDPVHPHPGPYLPSPQGGSQSHNPDQAKASTNGDWQSVPLPQVIQAQDLDLANTQSSSQSSNGTHHSYAVGASVATERETELLSLIHDLNACNDHLLQRVAQLEDALETSQMALQAEISRVQDPPHPSPSQTAAPHPQIAQLISDLDYAQQDLKQQRVLNETLKAQLSAGNEQIAQLERECALLRQRDGEQSQALSQAETNCRDLRVRLQRQQRYTLQFKVALEKSLDAAAHRSEATAHTHDKATAGEVSGPTGMGDAPSIVAMPKTQRIQPWSADAKHIQADQSLETLIQGMGFQGRQASAPVSDIQVEAPRRKQSQHNSPAEGQGRIPDTKINVDSEAETLLWKDLERVVDATADGVPSTKPDLNQVETVSAQAEIEVQPESSEAPISLSKSEPLIIETSMPESSKPNPSESPQFTEPSPWGAPLSSTTVNHESSESAKTDSGVQPQPAISEPVANPNESPPTPNTVNWKQELAATLMARAQNSQSSEIAAELPPAFIQQSTAASPSPVVHPLRPQKKIKSLAAVQLPNFPRRKA